MELRVHKLGHIALGQFSCVHNCLVLCNHKNIIYTSFKENLREHCKLKPYVTFIYGHQIWITIEGLWSR